VQALVRDFSRILEKPERAEEFAAIVRRAAAE
jgi:hypothetical protein